MTDPLWINADAGEPEYNAVELRRNLRMLLTGGVAHRLGARSGVHPAGSAAVSLSGQTVTVHDASCVIYPGLSSQDGPYLAHFVEHTHVLDPADGSNPRRDIIVARIYDDDHDASGRREAVTEYLPGNPSPSADPPATPAGALRMATVLVPAGGSPSPTLTYDAPLTVAAGGVLPVREAGELPASGLYDGMVTWDQAAGALLVRSGGGWQSVALAELPLFRAFLTANQALAAGNEFVMGTMTVDYALGGAWSQAFTTAGRDIPLDGYFDLYGQIRYPSDPDGVRQIIIRKNVSSSDPTTGELMATVPVAAAGSGGVTAAVRATLPLEAGDNIVFSTIHTAGNSLDRQGGTSNTYWEARWVRPL